MSYSDEFAHLNDDECRRFQAVVELTGRKWNSAILMAGARGARRFSEYRALVDGISDRMLTARLQELEREGLMERHVQPSMPVMITYTLTTAGGQLLSLLHPLVQWSIGRGSLVATR